MSANSTRGRDLATCDHTSIK